ncbi:hypothetical protein D9757_001512 [Collybiopsis confluens]|uniref:AB hydrolase-1 domain-containing protein n=1 Tax=Collybiopsis confluens TaxID=2823264 RepID=A0A8H5MFX4_9AGAR|nr:hypothetical protein D9757_001512 [Collybiopsis confluens]
MAPFKLDTPNRPSLPSPPRVEILWNDFPYKLSTHIVEAFPFRACPEFEYLQDTKEAHARMQALAVDAKQMRIKIVRENTQAMFRWQEQSVNSTRQGNSNAASDPSQPRLWICLNRYVKNDIERLPRKTQGLTLFLANALGMNKEAWEPFIRCLFKTHPGKDIDEIWAWEPVDSGDSALLNAGNLKYLSNWSDLTNDLLHFFLHYMPSRITSDQLPVHLPRVSSFEYENRVKHGFAERRIIVIGHSYGGSICVPACYTHPQLFTALVLSDPPIIRRGGLNNKEKQTVKSFIQASFARRDGWKTREEALAAFQHSSYSGTWHPDALKQFVDHGLYFRPDTGLVHLKMHPVYEALNMACAWGAMSNIYDIVPDISEKLYIKWVMPDEKNGGGLDVPSGNKLLVKRRPGNTTHVNVADTSHHIPLEKPNEYAREVANTIEQAFATQVPVLARM